MITAYQSGDTSLMLSPLHIGYMASDKVVFCPSCSLKIFVGSRQKICVFYTFIKCYSIYYNSVKIQVDRLRNKKVTIYPYALSYKQVIMITQWDK